MGLHRPIDRRHFPLSEARVSCPVSRIQQIPALRSEKRRRATDDSLGDVVYSANNSLRLPITARVRFCIAHLIGGTMLLDIISRCSKADLIIFDVAQLCLLK